MTVLRAEEKVAADALDVPTANDTRTLNARLDALEASIAEMRLSMQRSTRAMQRSTQALKRELRLLHAYGFRS